MTDLPNLIARLEAAEGPSRELDREIAEAVGMELRVRGSTLVFVDTDGSHLMAAPDYTASLDAAVSLVPEGWWWLLEQWGFAKPDRRQIFRADLFQPKQEITAHAPIPALALCIAALKVMEAEK